MKAVNLIKKNIIRFILKKSENMYNKTNKIRIKLLLTKIINKCNIYLVKFSVFFDYKYYSNTYNIQINSSMLLAKHYTEIGWKNHYNPSLVFNTDEYLKINNDVLGANFCPLLHYEKYGYKENRIISIQNIHLLGNYKSHKIYRFIKRKISFLINYKKIRKNKNSKILVCLHIFYIKSFKEIKEYLKNLEKYNYDLIVTYVDGYNDNDTLNEIKKFKNDVKLLKYQNKGYDIGPFIDCLKNINLKKYDIIIKLHSKRTGNYFVYNQYFYNRDWFINIYEGILGAFKIHKTIDILLKENKIGLVTAKNLIVTDPSYKERMTISKAKKLKIKVHESYKYVAGTGFAIRANLLENVKKLNINIENFEDTNRGFFSLAHFFERFICFAIINQGYDYYGNSVCNLRRIKWKKALKILNKFSAINIIDELKDKGFEIDDDFAYFSLESKLILDYSTKKIKLGEINRLLENKIYKLKECAPYLYLKGDRKIYQEYSKYHKDNNLPDMNKQRFDKLIKSMENNGYNNKKIIVVDNNNIILDGQHRACKLLYDYGENYEITVLVLNISQINLNKIKAFKEYKLNN